MTMKLKNLLFGMLCMLALATLATACSDDNDGLDDSGSTVALPEHRVFILNEGTNKQNNAGILFYDPSGKVATISDIFKKQNSASLGDTAQDMIEYKGSIYVSVYGSNYLAKLNAAGVEQATVSFVNDADLAAGIRYIAAEGGYIYASFYGGAVAKINASTLKVEGKLTGLGDNLEGVAICNNKLYVCDSYRVEGTKYIYNKQLVVIDLSTFTKNGSLEVATNPNCLLEEDDKLFLISWDYSSYAGYVLQMIEPAAGNKVTQIGNATYMAAEDGILYLVNSIPDFSNYPETSTVNTFFTYNIATGAVSNSTFLKNAPEELLSTSLYMMEIDDETDDIYVGTTFYSAGNGNIYRFKKDGTFVEKFDCGGQNPKTLVSF